MILITKTSDQTRQRVCVCVCVFIKLHICVCVYYVAIPFILDVRLHLSVSYMWTHQPGSHRRKATQEFIVI